MATPLTQGLGFDRAVFKGNDFIQNLETFARNEDRTSGTGAFRGLQDLVLSTARREGVEEDAEEARGLAGRAADVGRGTFERQTATLSLTDRQRRAANRRLSLRRRIGEASAGSAVRRAATDAATGARKAGASLSDIAFGQQLQGLTGLANAEGQRQTRRAAEEAQDDADRNGLIGSIAGAGLALLSSEEAKDKVGKPKDLLDRLKKVRVEKWKYKDEVGLDTNDHIGVFAEEFNDTFGVNQGDRRTVSLIDLIGVSLGAMKELNQKVESLNGQ